MNILITGQQVELTAALQEYATDKIQKLAHYEDDIIKIHVVLKVEGVREEDKRHIAHADVHLKGKDLYAKAEAESMYAAIDALSGKLIQQTRKFKEKEKEKQKH